MEALGIDDMNYSILRQTSSTDITHVQGAAAYLHYGH
jgi:hypothetical protein